MPAGADEGVWVTCTGRAALHHITPEEAKAKALEEARRDAVEQVCGVRLQGETLVQNARLASDFIHAISYGHVVDVRDTVWTTEQVQVRPNEPPSITYIVTLRARVAQERGEPDPAFSVSLTLNRTAFEAGDEMALTLSATQDCHVTVLNIGADDTVRVLLPNVVRKECRLKAEETLTFPGPTEQGAGLHLRVYPLPGHREDAEVVKVIATRSFVPFGDGAKVAGGFGVLGTPAFALTDLARRLVSVPMQDRAEATATYRVIGKVRE